MAYRLNVFLLMNVVICLPSNGPGRGHKAPCLWRISIGPNNIHIEWRSHFLLNNSLEETFYSQMRMDPSIQSSTLIRRIRMPSTSVKWSFHFIYESLHYARVRHKNAFCSYSANIEYIKCTSKMDTFLLFWSTLPPPRWAGFGDTHTACSLYPQAARRLCACVSGLSHC